MKEVKDESLYQFEKSLNYPVFIRVSGDIASKIEAFLKTMRFEKVASGDLEKTKKLISTDEKARVLNLTEATINISAQIEGRRESDLFSPESISPTEAGRVYRYRDIALMLYSFRHKEWQVAFVHDFLTDDSKKARAGMVIHRFLSWSLSVFGVVGFWGAAQDDRVIIFKNKNNISPVFYIDVLGQKIISEKGVSKIKGRLIVARPLGSIRGTSKVMSKEELLSFLHHHSIYFDYSGPSVPVRQVIQKLSIIAQGIVSEIVEAKEKCQNL